LVDCRSTTGDPPLTVIVSATAPGDISVFTVAVNPSATWMSARLTVPKPDSSNIRL
jgi:hypothetical protein